MTGKKGLSPGKAEHFYRDFDARFRGSAEEIRRRLGFYEPFVTDLREITNVDKVLDLGCGRGEWLELLTDLGFDAIGVDLDEGMLEEARERGLVVKNNDILDYLEECADGSFALISAIHVVEHLPFATLKRLVKAAFRCLAEGGLLILETPNPENLLVGAASFYLDPSHQRPLPPELLRFIAEYSGFKPAKIVRLQEDASLRDADRASLLQVLTGASPDYAVIAQKPIPRAVSPQPTRYWPVPLRPITA